MEDIALPALIIVTLGLCTVTVMTVWVTDPKKHAVITAGCLLLIGVAFGAMISLSTVGHMVGCR